MSVPLFERKILNGKVVFVPNDRAILDAIRTAAPEYYDSALENYQKKLRAKGNG